MKKLKTLKDIETFDIVKMKESHSELHIPNGFVEKSVLKAEAIKWIMGFRIHNFYCVICEEFDCDCLSSNCFKPKGEDVEHWIRHFHNITEEDLK